MQSAYARTGLIDGVPVAMWGITGTILSSTGHAWLSVTPECRARRLLVGRVARAEAAAILATTDLASLVLDDDARARRFLRFLGFEIGEISTAECGRMFRHAVLKRKWNSERSLS